MLRERGGLTVAMEIDLPGYFSLNGENWGYLYDLLKAYTDHIEVDLVVTQKKRGEVLQTGKVDVTAMLTNRVDARHAANAWPAYNTSYILLARRRVAKEFNRINPPSLPQAMFGRRLALSGGFRRSESYAPLLDSLRGTTVFRTSGNSFDLIGLLSVGKYDYLICEKSEAQLGCALVRNIAQVFEFAEPVSMSLVFGSRVPNLQENFLQWYEQYMKSDEYTQLNNRYFENGILGEFIGRHAMRTSGGISIYDDLMRTMGEEGGYDWRLLSAIAWTESNFNAYVISYRGACGLMQIMPIVARQFDISEEEMMKPEVNIRLAIKLLNKINQMLKLPSEISCIDRISLMLACYNSGTGHVIDARNLAAKHKGNPNSWADVSRYLQSKSESDYWDDEVVEHGYFGGGEETLAFVEKVMRTYQIYCNKVER